MALLSERTARLGDPTRTHASLPLRDGERNVQLIADALLTTQQNVSGHLRLLRAGGVVSRRPVGREVFYASTDGTAFDAWETIVAGLQARRHG